MKTFLAVSSTLCAVAVVLQFGVLAGSAQTGQYLFSGTETSIALNPGTYDITAFGAAGGNGELSSGGLGAEMQAQFNFATTVNLTLLVGGCGGVNVSFGGGGGGGGSFVVNGSIPLVIAGGGGGGGYTFNGNANGGNGIVLGTGGDGSGEANGFTFGGTGGSGGEGGGGGYAGGAGGGGVAGTGSH